MSISGLAFRPQDANNAPGPDLIACFRTSNIQRELDKRDVLFIPRSLLRNERQVLQDGDILISTANSDNLVGKCVIVEGLNYEATLGGFITGFRVNHSLVIPRFFYHWLSSPIIQARLRALARRTTNIANLAMSDFAKLKIPLPPLSEQRRIVEILQEAEKIRRLRVEAESKTAELIPAMFYEVLDKDEASKKRPLGHWFEAKPNYGTMTPADAVPGNDGVICLRVGNIQNNRIDLSDRKYVQRTAIHAERHTVRTGDIVLARAIASEEHLGKAVVITPQEDGFAFDSHLMRIRLRKDELVPEFLQVYLYSAQGRNAFLKQARQSAVQFNVNAEEMARVMVPEVDPREQMKVVQAINEAEAICKVLEASTTQSSMLAASLSTHAFSGQLTADWRATRADMIAHETRERDTALKQSGTVTSFTSSPENTNLAVALRDNSQKEKHHA